MRCGECGAWLRDEDRFCPRCGTAKPETVQPIRLPHPERERPWVPLAYIIVLAIAVTIIGAVSGAFTSHESEADRELRERASEIVNCYPEAPPCR